MWSAILANDLNQLISCRESLNKKKPDAVNLAATFGRTEILKWLIEEEKCAIPYKRPPERLAAQNGHLDCLIYLYEHSSRKWSKSLYWEVCIDVVDFGSLQCLQWLHENSEVSRWWDKRIYDSAAFRGNLDCLRYLHENGCPRDPDALTTAAGHGQLDCLKYLHEQGHPLNAAAIRNATRCKQFDCLQYLHGNGCPIDGEIYLAAVQTDDMQYVRYVYDEIEHDTNHSWPGDERACEMAARNGNVECLEYLHRQGCPWDESTTIAAAGKGHLWCLIYACREGCPCSANVCSAAVAGVQLDCLKWLIDHDCPIDKAECLSCIPHYKYCWRPIVQEMVTYINSI